MSVPAEAVAGAVFTIERSDRKSVVEGESGEVGGGVGCCGGVAAATVAVLGMGPDGRGLMWTTMVKVWVALGARVPKVQVTVPAALVQPAQAETKLTWAGRTSVTVPPLEAEGPLLVTVRV